VTICGNKGCRAEGRRSTALREVKGPEAGRRWLCIMTPVRLPSIFAVLHLHLVSSSRVSSDESCTGVCNCAVVSGVTPMCSDRRMRNASNLNQTVLGCREGNLGTLKMRLNNTRDSRSVWIMKKIPLK
jgi:hypothetical protein